jgi:NitT/TauT family transport system permease protein
MPSTRPSEAKAPQRAGSTRASRLATGAASLVILVLIWKLLALLVGKDILLPPPEKVLGEALALYPTGKFLAALWATFLRGSAAFLISLVLGSLVGLAAGLSPLFDAALAPILTIIRATPVLALILVALLWFPSGFVPVFAAVLMCFPIMVTSASSGVHACDRRLLEMAALFQVPRKEQLLRLRLPEATPFLLSGARNSLGMSWKVVVAGEVLSQPLRALGSGMQESRVLLETPRVLAWAAASVLLCGLTEWLFGFVTKAASRHGI